MTEKIEEIYKRLQELDIKPTKTNMEKLLQCLYDLQDIYSALKGGEENDGTADQAEQRDGH